MTDSSSKRTIVVTGANGNNGREAVRALQQYKDSVNVRLLVRDPSKVSSSLGEVVKGDLSDEASLESAFKGADAVYLIIPTVENAQTLVKNALTAAKKVNVKFILKLGAICNSKDSSFWLGRDHFAQDEQVKSSGIPYALFQPTFFYTNLLNFNGASLKAQGAWYGSSGGDQSYSLIDTNDIGEAAAKVLVSPEAHKGKSYVLTGPELLTDNEIAKLASEAFGKPIKYVNLTPEAQSTSAAGFGMPAWLVESLVGLEEVKRNGWAREVTPHLEQILGHKGRTFKEYLAENKNALA